MAPRKKCIFISRAYCAVGGKKGRAKITGPKFFRKTLCAAAHFREKKMAPRKNAFFSRGRSARSAEKKYAEKFLGRQKKQKKRVCATVLARIHATKNVPRIRVKFYKFGETPDPPKILEI